MAEFDQPLVTFTDPQGGVCGLVAVCEDSQTELDPEGTPSPLVVRIRVLNSTGKRGGGTWMHANGQFASSTVLPGENAETNIAPPQRVALYRLAFTFAWFPGV